MDLVVYVLIIVCRSVFLVSAVLLGCFAFLGVFAMFQIVTLNFGMSVSLSMCPSILPHGTTRPHCMEFHEI